ncbi:MAG: SEC-C metal-binding domain-containing protein [Bacteroidota bacterium]
MIDLSTSKRRYYSRDCGLKHCPECGSELLEFNCTILLSVKTKSDQGEFMTNHSGSHFCTKCPVVVFDNDQVIQAAAFGIRASADLQYLIEGIIDLNRIPDEKKHLEIGTDENPVPLVRFLPDKNTAKIIAAKTPLRNEPCSCGSGLKFKKCCGK